MNKSTVNRLLTGLLVLAILFIFVYFTWEALLLTFAGLLLAILLRGVTIWIASHTPFNIGWSYTLFLILVIGLITLAAWLIAPRAISESAQIVKTIPKALTLARNDLNQYDWGRHVVNFAQHTTSGPEFGKVLGKVTSGLEEAVEGIVVILVVAFFFALQPDVYTKGVLLLFPPEKRSRARDVFNHVGYTLHWWILGQMVPMIFLGVVSMIGLWLLNIPLAFALGLFTGVMIFIPYVGALLSEIPAALVALVQGPDKMVEVIILYLVVHVLEGYILTPWAQRKAVHLPPALTILAQLFMLKLAGLLGVIVATPLAAAILALVQKLYLERHAQASFPAASRQIAGR